MGPHMTKKKMKTKKTEAKKLTSRQLGVAAYWKGLVHYDALKAISSLDMTRDARYIKAMDELCIQLRKAADKCNDDCLRYCRMAKAEGDFHGFIRTPDGKAHYD